MMEVSDKDRANVPALCLLTLTTGLIDAVSYLALGHVFTANMTGNVVLLGFATAGAPGLSIKRSLTALVAFLLGAIGGGRLCREKTAGPERNFITGLIAESCLLGVATAVAIGSTGATQRYLLIIITAIAMGIRNAVVRALAVPDMTTTVLTLTLTGLAADSSVAGNGNPRWGRRVAAVLCMLTGAAAGAKLLMYSLSLPLIIAALIPLLCAISLAKTRPEVKLAQTRP